MLNRSGAEAVLFPDNKINTMTDKVIASNMQDKHILIVHEDGLNYL